MAVSGSASHVGSPTPARISPWSDARHKIQRGSHRPRGARVEAIAVATDVTDKAAVADMVEHVVGEFGRVDILVNNAGINIRKPPHALELDEWHSVIDTNLTSAFLCSKAVYPAMKPLAAARSSISAR